MITHGIKPPPRSDRADLLCFSTALLRDRVYSTPMSPWGECALTALFHYDRQSRLHLSVALVLRSPSAGVTRYPCPVKPGLSSSGAFRPPSAAVQPGCENIVTHCVPVVKCLANSFVTGYTIMDRSMGMIIYRSSDNIKCCHPSIPLRSTRDDGVLCIL